MKYKIIAIPKTKFFPERILIKKDNKSAWINCDGEAVISENFSLYPEDLEFLANVGRNFRLFFENGKTFQQWEEEEKLKTGD